ncbi:MAG: ATP-binding protein, partial [Roseovarius indicus]
MSRKPENLSGAAWLVSEGAEVQAEFLDSLSDGEILALPYLFEFWAMAHQMPPEGDWRAWVAMGGRGAGQNRAGGGCVRGAVG